MPGLRAEFPPLPKETPGDGRDFPRPLQHLLPLQRKQKCDVLIKSSEGDKRLVRAFRAQEQRNREGGKFRNATYILSGY